VREIYCFRRRPLTSEKNYRLWLGYMIVGLYFGWFILTALSSRPVEALSRYIPGWLATLTWASSLILIPIGRGPLKIPENLRVSLDVLLLVSFLLLPVAVHFHFTATLLISGLFCSELFWLIPQWKAKWNRDHKPR
jgi:hypothetical protein